MFNFTYLKLCATVALTYIAISWGFFNGPLWSKNLQIFFFYECRRPYQKSTDPRSYLF